MGHNSRYMTKISLFHKEWRNQRRLKTGELSQANSPYLLPYCDLSGQETNNWKIAIKMDDHRRSKAQTLGTVNMEMLQ
jgi:hypothetical protein